MSGQKSTPRGLVLVSNDRTLRRQLRTCLPTMGITAGALTMVSSGRECLEALAKLRPRLVALDDGIADVTGPVLLRALHEHDPRVLVLSLTTHHTLELERAVRQIGVLYYTEKPPDTMLLSRVFGAVLGPETQALRAFSRGQKYSPPRMN